MFPGASHHRMDSRNSSERSSSPSRSRSMSSTYLVDFVDKAVFAQSRGNSLVTRRVNKNSRNVKINEIDELKEAMEILFGEQQEQTN